MESALDDVGNRNELKLAPNSKAEAQVHILSKPNALWSPSLPLLLDCSSKRMCVSASTFGIKYAVRALRRSSCRTNACHLLFRAVLEARWDWMQTSESVDRATSQGNGIQIVMCDVRTSGPIYQMINRMINIRMIRFRLSELFWWKVGQPRASVNDWSVFN